MNSVGREVFNINNFGERSNDENVKKFNETNYFAENMKNSEHIIYTLKENIKSIKREYKNLHQNYALNISQTNEAQQLLQKCIEDVKFDIVKVNTDISIIQKKSYSISQNEKLNQELKMKKYHLSSLENKLKILTFVYDNAFSSNKFNQNKFISTIVKK